MKSKWLSKCQLKHCEEYFVCRSVSKGSHFVCLTFKAMQPKNSGQSENCQYANLYLYCHRVYWERDKMVGSWSRSTVQVIDMLWLVYIMLRSCRFWNVNTELHEYMYMYWTTTLRKSSWNYLHPWLVETNLHSNQWLADRLVETFIFQEIQTKSHLQNKQLQWH